MQLTLATAHLSDDEFIEAFQSCRLKNGEFRHADHLRLAWLQLRRAPLETAIDHVRQGIRRFAEFHGTPGLYHETVTVAWVRLLATHHEETFAEFLSRNSYRLNKDLLHRFWTPEALASEQAKTSWVPPDRMSLPG